jgi:hypothetical protein
MGQMTQKFSDIHEKSVPLLQRKKMARRMAKMARSAIFKMKKARSALRRKTPEKILALARKKAINMMRKKFYPTYKDMAFAQRIKIDQRIMVQFGKKIDKISKKLAIIIKKGEGARIAKARESQKKAKDNA